MILKHYKDVPAEPVKGEPGLTVRWLIAKGDGAPNFAMRYMEVEPGASSPHHSHRAEHEVFVLGGQGVARSADDEVPVKTGDVVYVAPDEVHQFVNIGQEPLTFI
jgi:quercetin dioxygenase-like cupin family protein